jgi:hypothetical protein
MYSPSVGVIGLAEYVRTHPSFTVYSRGPRLFPRRRRVGYRPAPSLACVGPPLDFRMAQDSDDPHFVASVVVWTCIVFLAIVALHCPLPRRADR